MDRFERVEPEAAKCHRTSRLLLQRLPADLGAEAAQVIDAALDVQDESRAVAVQDGEGRVLDVNAPEVVERTCRRVDERAAHDRIVGRDEHVRARIDERLGEVAPAFEHVVESFAAFERDVRRILAPRAVALGIVRRELVAIAAFPGSVRDLDEPFVGLDGDAETLADEARRRGAAQERAGHDERRDRFAPREPFEEVISERESLCAVPR